MLDLQPSTVVFQIINFLILMVILSRFLYRPVQRTMRQRQAAITAQLNQAALREAEAVAERERLAQQADAARTEAQRTFAQARAEVAAERERILQVAREDAARLKQTAECEIRQREEQALAGAAVRVRVTAASLAASLIREAAGPEVHRALMDRLLSTNPPSGPKVVIELAYPPDGEIQARLNAAHASVRVNPDLIAGGRILTNDQLLVELSLSRTLHDLEVGVAT